MRIDCHIHSRISDQDRGGELMSALKNAGFGGAFIFSHDPRDQIEAEARIDAVLKIAKGGKYLFPFFFIDPTEPDALEQVALAVKKGIMGFKVICFSHFPDDSRAMPVYREIAKLGKPILFHSGILYDGRNDSSKYHRPCNFECLITIDRLRFALAHVSWPWTDECVALYGKFSSIDPWKNSEYPEMFIDNTPGTPDVYRKPMYDRLLFSGYPNIKNSLMFGSDSGAGHYSGGGKAEFDDKIFGGYDLDGDFADYVYFKNALRFLGLPEDRGV